MPGIDANTLFCCHPVGADGSTTFIDSSPSARTITANGDAQVDTAQSKFSGGSLLLDGTGDSWTLGNDNDFQFGTNPFTIEAFAWPDNDGATLRFYGDGDAGDTTASLRIRRGATNKLVCSIYDVTVTPTEVTSTTDIIAGSFYHIAFVRTGNTLKLFINGTQEGGDQTFSVAMNSKQNSYKFGQHGALATGLWKGWIDEPRISNVARYTANFTPPTKRFSVGPDNVLYRHFFAA